MARPMFGVESEYAIAGLNGKEPVRREDLLSQFLRAAHRRLPHLPDMGSPSGIFLEGGGRFYADAGLHPEMTTPECTTPWEAARYIKAGERILEGLTQEVAAEAGASEIMCFRCNVDYSGTGSTWGCHESYLHRADPASLPDQLIPHLVTRVIYTGAGGFNPLTGQLEFCVAPRLMHIQQVISGDSTANRGIYHTKNETLAGGGYNRLHILCGESLCSETAIVLKIGSTALVTAMAEEGLRPGGDLRLSAPLEALRAVSADVTCKRKMRLADGRELNAIEIQRLLLELAERNRGVLPTWADEICALWRITLDRLEDAPDSVATVLDWAIKHRLFRGRIERQGIPEERLALLNSILQQLNEALAGVGVNGRDVRLSAVRGAKSPIPEQAGRIEGVLRANGLAWNDLEHFMNLRDEFYQIDTRFGQIGGRGIFTELDRRGVLDHQLPAVGDVAPAMRQPPAVGRARLRGEVVGRLAGQNRAACTWMAIFGPDGRTLDLSDPFAGAEVWLDGWQPQPGGGELPLGFPEDATFGDSGRLQHMMDAMRRRYGRTRSRTQGPTETTEGPGR